MTESKNNNDKKTQTVHREFSEQRSLHNQNAKIVLTQITKKNSSSTNNNNQNR